MNEVDFAKQFLAALSTRPVKLPGDHVTDPKTIPPDSTYLLPRMPHKKHIRARAAAPLGQSASSTSGSSSSNVTVVLRPLRSPSSTSSSIASTPTASSAITLSALTPTTSIYEIKVAYARQIGAALTAADKMKVFHTKKLCADARTVAEVVGGPEKLGELVKADGKVEMCIMVMGGVSVGSAGGEGSKGKESAGEVLRTDEFWTDLKGFLGKKLRDEGEGAKVGELFRKAWSEKEG